MFVKAIASVHSRIISTSFVFGGGGGGGDILMIYSNIFS